MPTCSIDCTEPDADGEAGPVPGVHLARDRAVPEAVPGRPAGRRRPDARAGPRHPLRQGRPQADETAAGTTIRSTPSRPCSCPRREQEANKLLLTKTYKKRMLEAFKALVTKRRETHRHVRSGRRAYPRRCRERWLAAEAPGRAEPELLPPDRPRLCVSSRISSSRRSANDTLENAPRPEAGRRAADDLPPSFTPCAICSTVSILLSAEDIGMKPDLAADEHVDIDAAIRKRTTG